ncbi:hypothetical protein [Streptomyces pilosus]|uniref:Mce-associated membrane protein n=1 Tax=Streptomyces pilosus TaxID=28893 RepID=A0A918BF95_9ACTN|nr:hypothetical protein [Streptomyces pilosus]GGQ62691.1 hypothetical protein GCM10010280_06130 [Streptomyces pilosus]GGV35960.1 hypothetical protein GCM10010261_05440 [Streptomyces pilosus]
MRAARVLGGVGLAVAVAFCGTGAWTYAQARADDALAHGRERDRVLADGRERVAVLTTLDASTRQRAATGIRAWRDASTGPLREELDGTGAETGASARGTVTEAAVTALDTRAGTAKLIVTVRVEVTPAGTKRATTDRKRLEAVLARTGEGEWKVKALSAVPLSGGREEGDR